MKMKVRLLFFSLFLALLSCSNALAQVNIYDFKQTFPTPPSTLVLTEGSSQYAYCTFEITIEKPVSQVLDANSRFQLYVVTAQTLNPLPANNLTYSSNMPTTWQPVGNNRHKGVMTGSFFLTYNRTSNGFAREIEMLYTGVIPSGSPSAGTPYSVYSTNTLPITIIPLCGPSGATGNGDRICQSQNVPYTSQPAQLTGQEKTSNDHVYRWECNYTGNDYDWQGISGAEYGNFQPWNCWQTVRYRRQILYEGTNMWGQTYHDFVSNGNEVLIIPYVAVNSGTYLLRNRWSGQVLDIGGSDPLAEGGQAVQMPSNGAAKQRWNINSIGDGKYTITNSNSQKLLTIAGKREGDRALQYSPASAPQNTLPQGWLFLPVEGSPGFYTITNAYSGQVLEICGGAPYNTTQGADAKQWSRYYQGYNTHQEQEWELISVPTTSIAGRFPGVYTLVNVNSNQLLEIGGGQPAPATAGSFANQWTNSGTSNQHWTFTDLGNGYYKILSRGSGMALEIGGSSNANGAFVNQWPYNGNPNQQWSISEVSPGIFSIINRNSNQAMEIGGGSTSGGVRASQWWYYATPHQHWYINSFAQNRMAASTQESETLESQQSTFNVFPSPTSGTATISYSLPRAASVSIDITDAMGWRVTKLIRDQKQDAGEHAIPTPELAKGIYTVRLIVDGATQHRKLVVE